MATSDPTSNRAKAIIDDINITTNPTVQFQQEFANPLLESTLDIRERSIPDYNYQKYFFNVQKSLTNLSDSNFDFLINPPHPWLLNSLYFDVTVKLTSIGGAKAADEYKILPMCNFYNGLFSAIKIQVGQNTQEIDHIGQMNQEWGYIWKALETTQLYPQFMGHIDLFAPDNPETYQFEDGKIDPQNKNGRFRFDSIMEKFVTAGAAGVDSYVICRGKFQPAHLLFQKEKMWPPYVPLRFTLCKNDNTAAIKTTNDADVNIEFMDCKVFFKSFEILQEGYDKFERAYVRGMETPKDIDVPINPYRNPLAIYNYLDIRASKQTIPTGTSIFSQPIRWAGPLPKGMIFCITAYNSRDRDRNHFEFNVDVIKCYQISKNSETRIPCKVCVSETSSDYQDFYERLRNFLGAGFTAADHAITYNDLVGGQGILAELFNPQDTLNIHSRLDIGSIELVIEFKEALPNAFILYTFLIYDQTLVVDEKGNCSMVIAV